MHPHPHPENSRFPQTCFFQALLGIQQRREQTTSLFSGASVLGDVGRAADNKHAVIKMLSGSIKRHEEIDGVM